MNMKKILASLMILTGVITATPVLADPIKLVGIDMTMSIEEHNKVLSEAGYKCSIKETMWRTRYRECDNGKKTVNPSKKKAIFNCENFNACTYTLKEFSQAFVDQGFVPTLEYKSKLVKSDKKHVLIESYCGNGEAGDRLCIVADKNLFDQLILTVTLNKGRLGSGDIKLK